MKVTKSDFGYTRVVPMHVEQKVSGIILPFTTRGMHATSIGLAISGEYKGKYLLYRANMDIKADIGSEEWIFVSIDAIICVMQASEGEKLVPVNDVDGEYGKEGWIGAVDGS